MISRKTPVDQIRQTICFPVPWLIAILLIFFSGCFKGEGLAPFIPPGEIRIDAFVPPLVYTNNFPVSFDAKRTLTLNGPRRLTFLWAAISFPPGLAPNIKKPGDPFTEIDGLVPGIYKIQLRVEDSAKNYAVSSFSMEVKQDTLTGAPKVSGLPDRDIYKPQDSIRLWANAEYSVNPKDRKLFFVWNVIQQPPGSRSITFNNTETNPYVSGFSEGVYRFQLNITNEAGLSAVDNMTLTVKRDTLAGTSKIYDNPSWVRTNFYFTKIRTVISEPTIFRYRGSDNMEVRLWDKNQQAWGSPLSESLWSIQDNNLIIEFDDDETHPFDLNTKLMVSFF